MNSPPRRLGSRDDRSSVATVSSQTLDKALPLTGATFSIGTLPLQGVVERRWCAGACEIVRMKSIDEKPLPTQLVLIALQL